MESPILTADYLTDRSVLRDCLWLTVNLRHVHPNYA